MCPLWPQTHGSIVSGSHVSSFHLKFPQMLYAFEQEERGFCGSDLQTMFTPKLGFGGIGLGIPYYTAGSAGPTPGRSCG